ncbi:hypothetical protein [Candidatus Methylobacter oryzae]|uniref:Uncharacterized protein n=1 Tax=Candidatus Methylobacter oryzae TaxID=2497749 RepID=A0ABY3CB69_9GAMM|nr:hypothetical protein [Candidatus Methylobacter oryzae]TRW95143.1 hypothetical protein EKO24_010510 [Candidatus Methylobacter oryzae]
MLKQFGKRRMLSVRLPEIIPLSLWGLDYALFMLAVNQFIAVPARKSLLLALAVAGHGKKLFVSSQKVLVSAQNLFAGLQKCFS